MRNNKRTVTGKRSNKLVGLAIVVMVVALVCIFNAKSRAIKEENDADMAKIQKLQQEIEDEQARAESLDEYAKYVNTKQFVEDVARKKLGLLYPDEKVFKNEK